MKRTNTLLKDYVMDANTGEILFAGDNIMAWLKGHPEYKYERTDWEEYEWKHWNNALGKWMIAVVSRCDVWVQEA